MFLGLGCLLALGLILARIVRVAFAPLLVGLVLIGAGAGIAKYRTEGVSSPVLGFRYYGAIEGRIINIDRSGSDALRLTLNRVILNRMSPNRTPSKVRVSVDDDGRSAPYRPGDAIMTTGHLSPPSGPAELGGFDFQRHAWFLQIGAVGYTRNPVVRIAVADNYYGWRLWIFQQRRTLAKAVRDQIAGESGAFVAAIMTGDRSVMTQASIADLRATNLAHLLAISGLHMGLLTGLVFAVVRMGLALIPAFALRFATKKIAAVVALVIGAGYLALSGGNVATERAYIMVAVLLDRRALTLRAVAMAATLVLILQPEALVGPGFQMSFAATTALVLVFGGMRYVDMSRLPKWVRIVFSVVLSSVVAGFATAPFAAAHFNQIAHFGLLANVLSVPLMGIVVMPAAVLAVCLAPLWLWGVGLWFVDQGLQWILFVARKVASIEGGVGHVVSPSALVLPILGISLIWIALWRGRGRLVGGVGVFFAFFLRAQTIRTIVLVADSGASIGLKGADGRTLSSAKGSGLVAGVWLENDGAPIAQMDAAAKDGFDRQGRQIAFYLGDWHIIAVTGKTAIAALIGCGDADILISNQTGQNQRPCRVIDVISLRRTSALAFDLSADGDLITTTARQVAGQRPWAPQSRQAVPKN